MRLLDRITLKAFLIAVEESNIAVFSEAEFVKVQALANDIENNLGRLDIIVENNPQLDAVYLKIRGWLQDGYDKQLKVIRPKRSLEQENIKKILSTQNLSENSQAILKMQGEELIAEFQNLVSKDKKS